MRRVLSMSVLFLAAAACTPQPPVVVGSPAREPGRITSSAALLDAMHARYADTWYRNLTFVQTSHYHDATGNPTRIEEWYEAAELPGRLRIDIGDRSGGNGQLYRNDSAYVFQNGKLMRAVKTRNPLLVLGFDVYRQDPARTLRVLQEEGFETSRFHRATADGKAYYVVGAAPGDTTSRQFWVEEDRLLFWRLIQPAPEAARDQRPSEIRFQKYVPHGGGFVAEEVDFLRGGRRYFFETYADVRVNVPLDPGLFIPEQWNTATFWR